MGLLRLGKISVLLSDTLVSGFCTAAAVHGMSSQLGSLLGIKVGKYNSDFKVILVCIFFTIIISQNKSVFYLQIIMDVAKNINSINPVSFSMSLATMSVLIVFKEFIKVRFGV